MAGIASVYTAVADFFEKTLGKRGRVTSIQPVSGGFLASFETVEEEDYMKRIGKDPMIAVYEVRLDDRMEILSYRRHDARSRNDLPSETQEMTQESSQLFLTT
jgi:hypothetical protein